jgi:hypothetical protein
MVSLIQERLETTTTTSLEMGAISNDKLRLDGGDGKRQLALRAHVLIFVEMDSLLIQRQTIETMEIQVMETDVVLYEMLRRDGSEQTTTHLEVFDLYRSSIRKKQQFLKQS